MLLQTLVQLNILILATPALAGWSLVPPVHFGMAHAAGIVWQYRGVETPAPKSETQPQARQVKPASVILPTPVPPLSHFAVFAADSPAALITSHSYPHAARAP